jgi:exodeoxyribonuclease VII small subunit
MSEELTPVDSLTYEQAVAEMETIIQQMEGSQLDLEGSLALFERGQVLAARCASLLAQAELKVRQLTGQEIASLQEEEQS